jgi:hypothetical protein
MSYLTSVHLYWFKVVDVRFHAIRLEFNLRPKTESLEMLDLSMSMARGF